MMGRDPSHRVFDGRDAKGRYVAESRSGACGCRFVLGTVRDEKKNARELVQPRDRLREPRKRFDRKMKPPRFIG